MTTTATKARGAAEGEARQRRPMIDPRIRARRREIKRSAGRRRLRRVIALGSLVVAAMLCVALTFTPLLDVDRLTVAGQFRTAPEDIVAAGGISRGDPLVHLDLVAAERRVEALPWVRRADVSRDWSGTVRYRIIEREPAAAVEAGDGAWFAVDGGGRAVAGLDGAPVGLPVIEGTRIEPSVGAESPRDELGPYRVAAAIPAGTRPLVASVVLESDRSVTIRLVAGGRVTVGENDDLRQKGTALAGILAAVDPCVGTLDLSIASAPVLTRAPGCG